MKRAFLYLATLIAIANTALHAQTILGTWQATLPTPDHPRIAIKFAAADNGKLRGTVYQLDKWHEGVPLSSVAFQSPDVTVQQINANIDFHGKLSADGESLAGIWTDGTQTLPLTFLLATPETFWKPAGPTPLPSMPVNADPTFELATIRPSPPDAQGTLFDLRTHNFAAHHRTIEELIEFAYNLRDRQIQGGPAWFTETRYDIAAEPDTEGVPSEDQSRLMLRKLLADRFHLKTHTTHPITPIYALTWDSTAPPLAHSDPEFTRGTLMVKAQTDGQIQLRYVGHTTQSFVMEVLMNFILDRQIVDETGLHGRVDFTIYAPSTIFQEGTDANEKATDMINALRAIGFRLTPKRAPLEILVIDHLEKPSAN
jgi:uncharacterized protein (TIGR03435 family)